MTQGNKRSKFRRFLRWCVAAWNAVPYVERHRGHLTNEAKQLLDRCEKKEKLRQVARRVYYEFEVTSNIFLKDVGRYAYVVCFSDLLIYSANSINAQMYMNIEFIELLAEISDAITHTATISCREKQRL